MPDIISRLLTHWADAGAQPAGGVTEEEIEAFQRTHNIRMPNDLRSYFLKVNGMKPDWHCDQDGNGFTFWPLARLHCLGPVAYPGPGESTDCPTFFVFADYLASCWDYAIGLWSREREGNAILLINSPNKIVANSFSEFVDLCVLDSPQLYPHGK
jgi:SMI1 / KNR4 family (SUKH-1)